MSDENIRNERPLDHATARIVMELAATLLPPLKEAVIGELARTVQALPDAVRQESGETLLVLNHLKETGNEAAASLAAVMERISEREHLREAPERPNPDPTELLRVLEAAIPAWEGILKADGRAHTRELSELSSEMSELLQDTRSNLLTGIREMLDKETIKRDAYLKEVLQESEKMMNRKLAEMRKLVFAWGFSSFLLAAVLLTVLFFALSA